MMRFASWIIIPAMLSGCVVNVANSSIGSGNASNNKVAAKAETKISNNVDAAANVTTQTNNQVNTNVAVNTQVNAAPAPSARPITPMPPTPTPSPTSSPPPSSNGVMVSTLLGLPFSGAQRLDAPTGSNRICLVQDGLLKTVLIKNPSLMEVSEEPLGLSPIAVAFSGNNRYSLAATKIVKPDGSSVTFTGVTAPTDFAVNGQYAYVTSETNACIYKVDLATGAGEILAGTAGSGGFADGRGTDARFHGPRGITFDIQSGSLFVADSLNHRIRKVSLDGTVLTYAGSGQSKAVDGLSLHAAFNLPVDITTDMRGNLFVADYGANNVRMVSMTNNVDVTTIAGNGELASTDGTGGKASFMAPSSIAYGNMAGKEVLWVGEEAKVRVVSDWPATNSLIANNALGYKSKN